MTFEEVTLPYRKQYGDPEDQLKFETQDGFLFVELMWFEKNIFITFFCPKNNSRNGWEVGDIVSIPSIEEQLKKLDEM